MKHHYIVKRLLQNAKNFGLPYLQRDHGCPAIHLTMGCYANMAPRGTAMPR
jgi:hypothetical protein